MPGGQAQQAISLLQAWAGRRGVNLMAQGRGLAAVLGTAARHELRDRLVRRFGRSLTALGPVFTGAAVAAYLNRRGTVKLAEEIRKDLAKRIPRQISPELSDQSELSGDSGRPAPPAPGRPRSRRPAGPDAGN